jgi:hypothetical protein
MAKDITRLNRGARIQILFRWSDGGSLASSLIFNCWRRFGYPMLVRLRIDIVVRCERKRVLQKAILARLANGVKLVELAGNYHKHKIALSKQSEH